jgi:hypothetical protein
MKVETNLGINHWPFLRRAYEKKNLQFGGQIFQFHISNALNIKLLCMCLDTGRNGRT